MSTALFLLVVDGCRKDPPFRGETGAPSLLVFPMVSQSSSLLPACELGFDGAMVRRPRLSGHPVRLVHFFFSVSHVSFVLFCILPVSPRRQLVFPT